MPSVGLSNPMSSDSGMGCARRERIWVRAIRSITLPQSWGVHVSEKIHRAKKERAGEGNRVGEG